LRQNARQRPVVATSRVACASLNFFCGHPVEQEDNFCMAERIQPRQRVGPDLSRVQLDRGSATSPIVVDRISPTAPHISYGFYRERHERLPSTTPTATVGRRRGVGSASRFRSENGNHPLSATGSIRSQRLP
jgi:hypothetical protein